MRLTHPAGGLRAAGARLLALIALATLLLAGCARERLHQQESYVFGTRVELLTWAASDAKAESAMAEVLREFDRLHRAYHAWEPSELTALNSAIAAGQTMMDELNQLAGEVHQVADDIAQHARHNDDGINHRQKRCQTGNNFLAHGAAAGRNFKHGVK